MAFLMNKLEIILEFFFIFFLPKIIVKPGAHYTCMCIILDKIREINSKSSLHNGLTRFSWEFIMKLLFAACLKRSSFWPSAREKMI
jgi:hypothetical protein